VRLLFAANLKKESNFPKNPKDICNYYVFAAAQQTLSHSSLAWQGCLFSAEKIMFEEIVKTASTKMFIPNRPFNQSMKLASAK